MGAAWHIFSAAGSRHQRSAISSIMLGSIENAESEKVMSGGVTSIGDMAWLNGESSMAASGGVGNGSAKASAKRISNRKTACGIGNGENQARGAPGWPRRSTWRVYLPCACCCVNIIALRALRISTRVAQKRHLRGACSNNHGTTASRAALMRISCCGA